MFLCFCVFLRVLLTVCVCRVLCSSLHKISPCLSPVQITPAMYHPTHPTHPTTTSCQAALKIEVCVSCCGQGLVSKCCLASQVEAPPTPACKRVLRGNVSCQAVFLSQVSSETELRGEVPCQGMSKPNPSSLISTPAFKVASRRPPGM